MDDQDQPNVRVPAYDLGRVLARKRRIEDAQMGEMFYDQFLDKELFDRLVLLARRTLRLTSACDIAIRESLLGFFGKELTHSLSEQIATILAGGYAQLKEGTSIREFLGVPKNKDGKREMWVPVEITELRYAFRRGSTQFVSMSAMAAAGPPVGTVFQQDMPRKYVTQILSRELAWGMYEPMPEHGELVRMQFYAQLVPDTKKKGTRIEQAICRPNQRTHNKDLRKRRASSCPRSYKWQCHVCPIGYSVCASATHRYTWIKKDCPKCKKESIYDPAEAAVECLVCSARRAKGGK